MLLAAAADQQQMLTTMAWAISVGAILLVVARRINVPGIVLLLLGGVALGPEVLGAVQPNSLGDGLQIVVRLAIGLILFEGGLTLDISGYREAPAMIKRLLTLGVLVTWFGTSIVVWLLLDVPAEQAVIAGSLVIVTGPTVIAPLLKRIQIHTRLHNILHWEGVLIDPIGVFIALLAFEWVVGAGGQEALTSLLIRIAWGLAVGAAGGFAISWIVKKKFVPDDMINAFSLGGAVFVFGIAELVRSEAGLLAVTVAGFVYGLTGTARIKQVRQFKAEITDLLIGTLFILLASRLEFRQFAAEPFGFRGLLAVAAVIFLVRPISIALCSWGAGLHVREIAFLSWVAPRGIVAASMASLITINLNNIDAQHPQFVETFTYSIIVATIILQGSTAGPLARMLSLRRPEPTGWLIVGAHALAQRTAQFLREESQVPVALVDTNARAVREAEEAGLPVILGDARDASLQDRREMQGVGNLLALTDNEDLNVRLCQRWADAFGPTHVFRCNPTGSQPPDEESEEEVSSGHVIWPKLPKPSLVSTELQRHEATVLNAGGHEPAFAQLATPLVAVIDGRVVFDADALEQPGAEGEKRRTLYLQRQGNYLLRSVRPELILTTETTDLRDLFDQIVGRVIDLVPNLPRDETIEELLERETSFPTVLGHGVAVPHAYSKEIDSRLCAIARLPKGMRFAETDSETVHLVFLLLSPQGDPEGHLATLAEIARLASDDAVRERLLQADERFELISIIRANTGNRS